MHRNVGEVLNGKENPRYLYEYAKAGISRDGHRLLT